jgi:DNA-directed RNA polymerase specialized sigma24 family protein
MRRRLVAYFHRKQCLTADDLADETLNRIARKIEDGTIADAQPAGYCYRVAKFVFLESLRRPEQSQSSFDALTDGRTALPVRPLFAGADAGREVRERLLDCLEHCLGELTPAERTLILDYYRGEQRIKIDRRRELAARLGVTQNALSIRVCRIRARLEACVRECSGEG